jgi:flagellar hook protein FlgE
VKCTLVNGVTAGLATKLRVGTSPVVLATLQGGTNGTIGGTPQTLLAAVANQDKLRSA